MREVDLVNNTSLENKNILKEHWAIDLSQVYENLAI
jgi:hypothetical protein